MCEYSWKYCEKIKTTGGDTKNLLRNGRPHELNDVNALKVEKGPFLTTSEIQKKNLQKVSNNVTKETIKRSLNRIGLFSRLPRKLHC